MTREQARRFESIGCEVYHSGGGIWLATKTLADGAFLVIDAEGEWVYSSRASFDRGDRHVEQYPAPAVPPARRREESPPCEQP